MTGRGHKHKRGERGSTRGTATLKRSNMAVSLRQDEDLSSVTHEPTNEQHKPERNLIELHESLVDIQINVNDILRENKEIRSEMEELKSTDQQNIYSQNCSLAKNKQSVPRGGKTTLCSEQACG